MKKKILCICVALALASLGMVPYSKGTSNPIIADSAGRSASLTYYVNNTNSSCNDTVNDGQSSAAPFCTIGRAANIAVAGDTVRVLAGTYAETVKPNKNGSDGSPITYSAAPGVIVTGETGNATNGGAFRLYAKSYIVIDGFTINGTADYGIIVTSSSQITLKNNHVSNSGSPTSAGLRSGIYFTATTDSFIIGNITDHNTFDGIRLNNASNNNWIEKNISYGNATQISSNATGINLLKSSSYNTIIRNITYCNEDTGLNFYTGSGHNLVINNVTYGNGDHGIDNNGAPYNTIVGNTVQGNVAVGINFEQDSSGNGSGGAVLWNNIFVDNGYRRLVGGGTLTTTNPGNIRADATSIASPAPITLDYDLIYSNPEYTNFQIIWGTTTYLTLAAFQMTGQEAHGLQANPLLAAPAPIAEQPPAIPFTVAINTGDYHIAADSPAVDSAYSDAPGEQATDIEGKPRADIPSVPNTGAGTRTYDDRGAYEAQPKAAQTISFSSSAPASAIVAGPAYIPTATATSGLAVAITVNASAGSVCFISAGVVSFIGVGTCVLDANQGGNPYYFPAPQVQQTFTVGKGHQVITVTQHAPVSAAKNTGFTVAATGGASGKPIVYSATSSCSNSGPDFTITTSTGTCYVHYNQAGNVDYTSAPEIIENVRAARFSQTITVTIHAPATAPFPYSFTVEATASSGLPVVYSSTGICTNNGAGFTMTGAIGLCFVHYNQAGNADYALAPEVVEVVHSILQGQMIYLPLVYK
jgi:parallel beta-helix repeat protein